jgi:uncharacterized protein (TIGR03089 family)
VPPTTCADILRTFAADPGRPRITWYGDAGERIELSGAVLENWVNKTTNLLVEEFDAAPGLRVLLDLPPHWRSIVWALAVWRAGACVVTAGTVGDPLPALVVTDEPGRHTGAVPVVAVALPALSRRYDGPLPSGMMDAASAVMTYGDVLGWSPTVDLDSPALVGPDAELAHRDLVPSHASRTPRERRLLQLDAVQADGMAAHLRDVLEILAADGSVVLVAGDASRELTADPARRSRMIASEGITSVG